MMKKRNNNHKVICKRVLNWIWHCLATISILTEGCVIYMISSNRQIPFLNDATPSSTCKESCQGEKSALTNEQLKALQIVAGLIRSNVEALRIWNEINNEAEEDKSKKHKKHNEYDELQESHTRIIKKPIILAKSKMQTLPPYIRQYGD